MKYYRAFLCAGAGLVFLTLSLFGQFIPHPLNIAGDEVASYIPRPDVPDTLRALAIMVQFQPDQDSRTTGNGQFDLSETDTDILNPPPHNAKYFEYHLEFARRYFYEVSGGKLTIEYTVWDQIFTLPEVMESYTPKNPGDFSEIGKLFEEAWRLASVEAPDIVFHAFDTFIIFHAGVGRDIDLTSIYGFDPTPLDIPSLYLGPDGLRRIFGSDYLGVEVGSGGFRISNSMVLPETQNREIDLITGRQLLQLGMNGLVCAMFGSRLGLPDLFNTDTGRSGIGRFGLMDGQSIFSFLGLFPPELSAWEKYHLGWIEPMTIQPGVHTLELPAVALRQPGSVIRVSINEREYYLVENRHRNPFGAGQTLTLIQNGEEVTIHVQRDRRGFNAFDISDISGIVLDVAVYDWSLPGGYVEAEDIFYDGGILIWHIDERIIGARIQENRINADIENRGIRVVEADGSQDIGREFAFLQAGQGSEDGTQFDFWYENNPAPIYQNRFDRNTIPPSKSNTGAPSHVAMYDFSARHPRMSVTIQIGSDELKPIIGFPVKLTSFTRNTSPVPFLGGILFVDNGQLYAVDKNGVLTHNQDAYDKPVSGTPAWSEHQGDIVLFTKSANSTVTIWNVMTSNTVETQTFIPVASFDIGSTITVGPALLQNGASLVGTDAGAIVMIDESGPRTVGSISDGSSVIDLHIFDENEWAATSRTKVLFYSEDSFEIDFSEDIYRSVAYTERGQYYVAGIGRNIEHITRPVVVTVPQQQIERNQRNFPATISDGSIFGHPISLDLDRDGKIDIVSPFDNKLYAFNKSGAVLDYFPLRTGAHPLPDVFPVAADFDDNGIMDVAVSDNDSKILFYNSKGLSVAGTPVAAGEKIIGSPAVFESDGKMAIAFITDDNILYAYSLSGDWSEDRVAWGQERFNSRRTNVQVATYPLEPISEEFLPENRAYNWPNPVYDGITYIRYYLSEHADVSIDIYEINGDRITSFSGPGIGGIDNEIAWDVSGLQSSVYLGRIEARGENETHVVFIKIAVVK
jgi:WD40 repeat protein